MLPGRLTPSASAISFLPFLRGGGRFRCLARCVRRGLRVGRAAYLVYRAAASLVFLSWRHQLQLGRHVKEAINLPRGHVTKGLRSTIALRIEGSSFLIGNRYLLHRAQWNIIRNAPQLSPRNALVGIDVADVTGSPENMRVENIDQGTEIAAADLESIFRPFYRSDQARTAAHGGLGGTPCHRRTSGSAPPRAHFCG